MFGVCSDPTDFWILTTVSSLMVFSAALLFIHSGPYLEPDRLPPISLYEPVEVEMAINVSFEIVCFTLLGCLCVD